MDPTVPAHPLPPVAEQRDRTPYLTPIDDACDFTPIQGSDATALATPLMTVGAQRQGMDASDNTEGPTTPETGGNDIGATVLAPHRHARAPARHFWPRGFAPWQYTLLDALAHRPFIRVAVHVAGVSVHTLRYYRGGSEEFDACCEEAMQMGWDRLEESAHSRAVDGVIKRRYNAAGVVISEEIVYSDGLAEMLLTASKPEKYRRKQGDVQVGLQVNLGDLLTKIRHGGRVVPEGEATPAVSAPIAEKILPKARTGPGRRALPRGD